MGPEGRGNSADVATLRTRLRHVYWIGGGSGAGKATIARRIAARHGLHVYSTDDAMPDHASRMAPEDAPCLSVFKTMDMDKRWVNGSPALMLETFHWYRGEGFGLIVEGLLRLPTETGVIAEGFRLLLHLVTPLLAEPNHAVWLLPTPEFRQAAFDSRGMAWDIPQRTSNPQRASHNLLERDRMFTDHLFEETERFGPPVIAIDTATSVDELAAQVTQALGL